jgi:DNA adenine methylase
MLQLSFFDSFITNDKAIQVNTNKKGHKLNGQLLKWIGNKQRFAHDIIGYFPHTFNTYFEPFLGSGAVLATLAPQKAIASDNFPPLIEIFKTLQSNSELLKTWYTECWHKMNNGEEGW